MKLHFLTFLLLLPALSLFSQGSKSALQEEELRIKMEQVKANFNDLFSAFKSDKQPKAELNFDNSYYTTLKFYKITGKTSSNKFGSDMRFRIESSDFKKATKEDFENAFTEISTQLKAVFDDLEVKESSTEKEKKIGRAHV